RFATKSRARFVSVLDNKSRSAAGLIIARDSPDFGGDVCRTRSHKFGSNSAAAMVGLKLGVCVMISRARRIRMPNWTAMMEDLRAKRGNITTDPRIAARNSTRQTAFCHVA